MKYFPWLLILLASQFAAAETLQEKMANRALADKMEAGIRSIQSKCPNPLKDLYSDRYSAAIKFSDHFVELSRLALNFKSVLDNYGSKDQQSYFRAEKGQQCLEDMQQFATEFNKMEKAVISEYEGTISNKNNVTLVDFPVGESISYTAKEAGFTQIKKSREEGGWHEPIDYDSTDDSLKAYLWLKSIDGVEVVNAVKYKKRYKSNAEMKEKCPKLMEIVINDYSDNGFYRLPRNTRQTGHVLEAVNGALAIKSTCPTHGVYGTIQSKRLTNHRLDTPRQ